MSARPTASEEPTNATDPRLPPRRVTAHRSGLAPEARTAPRPATAAHQGALPSGAELSRRPTWAVSIHVGALLTALATGLGLGLVLREALRQAASPVAAQSLTLTAFALGASQGLWYPRRLMLRRLARFNAAPQANLPVAGGVVAALVMTLGVVWLLTVTVTAGMESYRGWVIAGWLLPPLLDSIAMLGPLLLVTAPTAALVAVVLAAMQGWCRLALERPADSPAPGRLTAVSRLWMLAALALACGTWLSGALPERLVFLTVPLLSFVAAGVTALGHSAPVESSIKTPPETSGAAYSQFLIAAAGALAGLGLLCGFAATSPGGAEWALRPLALGGALGVWIGRSLLRLEIPSRRGAIALLVGGVWLLLPAPAWLVLLGAGLCAATTVTMIGREVAERCGSVQAGLVRTGVATLCGLLAVLIPTAVMASFWVVSAAEPGAPGRAAAVERLARDWLSAGLEGVEFVCGRDEDRAGSSRGPAACGVLTGLLWIDRSGPRADALVFERLHEDEGSQASAIAPDLARRLARRVSRALVAGGRVVIETPPSRAARAVLEGGLRDLLPASYEGFALRVTARGSTYEAVVLGPDVPAWLAERLPPDGAVVRLTPLSDRLTAGGESATVPGR